MHYCELTLKEMLLQHWGTCIFLCWCKNMNTDSLDGDIFTQNGLYLSILGNFVATSLHAVIAD